MASHGWSVRVCWLSFWIVSLVIGVGSAAKVSGIVIITPENVDQTIGYGYYSPVFRSTRRDWILLLFNLTNSRQQSTFQYLLPGLKKQLTFAMETAKQDNFKYPPIGLIDCYTCVSLCSGVGQEDLPLLIYKAVGQPPVRYRGYVTLSGLISFAKSHDPKTSYLAEQYKPDGNLINEQEDDSSKKEIKKMVNLLTQMMGIQEQQVEEQRLDKTGQDVQKNKDPQTKLESNEGANAFRQPTISQLIITNKTIDNEGETLKKGQSQVSKKSRKQQKVVEQPSKNNAAKNAKLDKSTKKKQQKQKQKQKQKNKNKNRYNQQDEDEDEDVDEDEDEDQQRNKAVKKSKSKKNKGKKSKKNDGSELFEFIEYLSGLIVSVFSALGFSGVALEIVSWISYIFFILVIGLIFLYIRLA